ERTGRNDEESEEAKPVREATAENRPRDEMHERQEDDLLVVGSAAARAEPDDLERAGELDGELERVGAEEEARDLPDEQGNGEGGSDVARARVLLEALRHEHRDDEADDDARRHPRVELAARDEREKAERREGVGHQPVHDAELHVVSPDTSSRGK